MANNQPKLVKVTNGVETPLYKEIVAGRQADCDLVLTEGHASRKHAKFLLADGAVWLEDLSSANGTFVNGQRITEQRLQEGDRVEMGGKVFIFAGPS
jgi:pSer/pThr/pTyr-binding forkhead associated (FHA) protein